MHTSYYSATMPGHRERPKNEARIVDGRSQGCGFQSHARTIAFFILNLAIMYCNDVLLLQCAHSVPVGIYSIVMWQISLNGDLKFHFKNIAHSTKNYKKTTNFPKTLRDFLTKKLLTILNVSLNLPKLILVPQNDRKC